MLSCKSQCSSWPRSARGKEGVLTLISAGLLVQHLVDKNDSGDENGL